VRFHDTRPVVVVTPHAQYVAFGEPWWVPLTAAAVAALLGAETAIGGKCGDAR
jgi:sugar/nucleoside kinase (ribokinase family)